MVGKERKPADLRRNRRARVPARPKLKEVWLAPSAELARQRKKIRRRTSVVGIFPDLDSYLRP
jgi:transposase-like protein